MKKLITLLFILFSNLINAQQQNFSINHIKLPQQLTDAENQFSGLQIANHKLYLLPECRVQEKHEARLYSIKLSDIKQYQQDSNYIIPFEKVVIYGLDTLAALMKKEGQEFEGLEALIIRGQTVYLSVETSTPSTQCFLLKGKIKNGSIYMNTTLTAVRKPTKNDGSGIYNAGFEAVTFLKKKIVSFYEFNYFDKSFAYRFRKNLKTTSIDSVMLQNLPFRITDITATRKNHFTALNYFYKGNGGDTVYRLPASNSQYALIHTEKNFSDYNRLIDIEYKNGKFNWKPLWTFPKNYTGYNWEGIAAYNDGYFVINDKFTLTRPYSSVLIYLTPVK